MSDARYCGYCHECGAAYPAHAGWPRTCAACGAVAFRNPIPVTIVLIPVDAGVLVVRRAIEPHVGCLALPGGYVDYGETWQAAGAREVWEEAGIRISPAQIFPIEVFSPTDNTLIIAGAGPRLRARDLPPFTPNAESSERVVLQQPAPLAFDLHTELVTRYLRGESLGYRISPHHNPHNPHNPQTQSHHLP